MKFKGILLWSFLSLNLVAIAQTGSLGNLLELRRFEGVTEPAGALAVSRDGRWAASGGSDGAVILRDLRSGQSVRTFRAPIGAGAVLSVAFSPDGRTLAAGTRTGDLRLWEASSGRELRRIATQAEVVYDLAFAPDGRGLAVATNRGAVRVFDPRTGRQLRLLSGRLELWNLPPGEHQVELEPTLELFAPSRLGVTLVTGETRSVQAPLELAEGVPASAKAAWGLEARGHLYAEAEFWGASLTPDGSRLALSDGAAVVTWDGSKPSSSSVQAIEFDLETAWPAFTPDGRAFAVTTEEGFELREYPSGKRLRNEAGRSYASALTQAFSPDGHTLLLSRGEELVLWDIQRWSAAATLTGHTADVYVARFSPDGSLIASGGEDGSTRLWDGRSGQFLRLVSESSEGRTRGECPSTHCAWSMGSRYAESGQGGTIYDLAFSPDGKLLATAGEDGTVRVWEVATGALLRTLEHAGEAWAVAISPDQQLIASAGEDGIHLWDLNSGRKLRTLSTEKTYWVGFSPDGRSLFSVGGSRATRWGVASGAPLFAPSTQR